MFVPAEPIVLVRLISEYSSTTYQPQDQRWDQRCVAVRIANVYQLAQAHCVAQFQGGGSVA